MATRFLNPAPVCAAAVKRPPVNRPTQVTESSENKSSDAATTAASQKKSGMAIQIVGEAPADKEKDSRHFQSVEERIATAQNLLENAKFVPVDEPDRSIGSAPAPECHNARLKTVVRMGKSKASGIGSLANGSAAHSASGATDFDCALHPDEVDDRLKSNLAKSDEARQKPITAPAQPAASWYPDDVAQTPRSAILGEAQLGDFT